MKSLRNPRIATCALVFLLSASLLSTFGQVREERQTPHFLIRYSTSGADAVPASYVRLVEESLEDAYEMFIQAGFECFEPSILVDILHLPVGELGTESLIEDGSGSWTPLIEIASPSVMSAAIGSFYTSVSFEDLVRSTCAHEIFHVLQDYADCTGSGDMSEIAWVEAHATAVQEFVVPTANDYLEPALEFLLAPDGVAFFHRSYDAGIYWVYVLDNYGIQILRDIMIASATYEGWHALDHAFSGYGTSFFETWLDFALALATGEVPDAKILSTLVPQVAGSDWWTRNRDPARIPALTYQQTWTGEPLTVHEVTAQNESTYAPYLSDDALGAPLRVAHSYGIDFLEILNPETMGMILAFTGNPETVFGVGVAEQRGGDWSYAAMSETHPHVIASGAEIVRLVVTRTESGTGTYSFSIRPSESSGE